MIPRRAAPIGVWLVVAASRALAQSPPAKLPCDSNLLQLAAPVNGYQPRGDRCEGVYARQVAGTTMFLSSFTETFEKYDLNADDPLIIRWAAKPDSGIQLRAETIKAGRYYRMDTRAAPRDSMYRWPNRILSSERLARSDLGVLGMDPAHARRTATGRLCAARGDPEGRAHVLRPAPGGVLH